MSGDPRRRLVYDVGMHLGQDTAYYLHRGFDVVAIEANPELARRGEQRFGAAIAAGRLRILPVGIAEAAGEAEFFVARRKSVWSSFDPAMAGKDGGPVQAVTVRCVPFGDVLRDCGVPFYLKVDIEGSDHLCLEALDPAGSPAYVSIEMSQHRGDRDIEHLAMLGYGGFKFIRQNDLSVLAPALLDDYLGARRRAASRGAAGRLQRAARGAFRRLRRPRRGGWVFPQGASGAFGEDLEGSWCDATTALRVWRALVGADRELSGAGLGDWFDVHATLGDTGASGAAGRSTA